MSQLRDSMLLATPVGVHLICDAHLPAANSLPGNKNKKIVMVNKRKLRNFLFSARDDRVLQGQENNNTHTHTKKKTTWKWGNEYFKAYLQLNAKQISGTIRITRFLDFLVSGSNVAVRCHLYHSHSGTSWKKTPPPKRPPIKKKQKSFTQISRDNNKSSV